MVERLPPYLGSETSEPPGKPQIGALRRTRLDGANLIVTAMSTHSRPAKLVSEAEAGGEFGELLAFLTISKLPWSLSGLVG